MSFLAGLKGAVNELLETPENEIPLNLSDEEVQTTIKILQEQIKELNDKNRALEDQVQEANNTMSQMAEQSLKIKEYREKIIALETEMMTIHRHLDTTEQKLATKEKEKVTLMTQLQKYQSLAEKASKESISLLEENAMLKEVNERLNELSKVSEDSIEIPLIRNLFIQYVKVQNNPKLRDDVLDIMESTLSFSKDEYALLKATPTTFSEAWVEYLDQQSKKTPK